MTMRGSMGQPTAQRSRFDYRARAGAEQRWVCGACGRHTALGGRRDELHDVSCVMHAVLCEAEQINGAWVAVKDEEAFE
jgi:hypothetical protein